MGKCNLAALQPLKLKNCPNLIFIEGIIALFLKDKKRNKFYLDFFAFCKLPFFHNHMRLGPWNLSR